MTNEMGPAELVFGIAASICIFILLVYCWRIFCNTHSGVSNRGHKKWP